MIFFINEGTVQTHVAPALLDELLAEGWRHFGYQFFRYNISMHDDMFCRVLPLRIRLEDFVLSHSQKKIMRKNRDLSVVIKDLEIDEKKIELFERHKLRFKENIPESIFTFVAEKKQPCQVLEVSVYQDNKLLACSFLSVGGQSSSSIYGMYDPDYASRSLGIFTMLLEIQYCIDSQQKYYYQGYCYDVPSFYDYKKRFAATEYYNWDGQWHDFFAEDFE